MFRRALIRGLVVGMSFAVGVPVGVGAFTILDGTPDSSLSFCVLSAPDGYSGSTVSKAQAKMLLQEAIANWHVAPGQHSSQALSLTFVDTATCSGVDFKLSAANLIAGRHAETDPSAGTIKFQDSDPWWDGGIAGYTNPLGRQSFEWSYEAILTHEIGHAIGLDHSGHFPWTYDSSSQYPTMAQCASEAASATFVSLQQDDWGGATWVDDPASPYFNANAGFEKDFTHWYRSNTTSITASSSYAYTGNRGARFASSGNYIYMTSVYDPWILENNTSEPADPAMDHQSPTFRSRTRYRHPSSSTTGGVELSYQRAYLEYDQTKSCKRDAYVTTYSFNSRTAFSGCGDPGTNWVSCYRDQSITLGQGTTDAVAFRVYFESTSSSYLYLDWTGVLFYD